MNNIGFSDLEEIIYKSEYQKFQTHEFFGLTARARKLRAIAILTGENQKTLPNIEKYKQQVFLNYTKTKGCQ